MANTESSAVIRFINQVQAQPIFDPVEATRPEPRLHTETLMVETPEAPPQRNWLSYALAGAGLLVAAGAVAFTIGSSGGVPGQPAAPSPGVVPAAAVEPAQPEQGQSEPAIAVAAAAPSEAEDPALTAPVEVQPEQALSIEAPEGGEEAVAQAVAYTGAFDIIVEPAGAKVLLDGSELGAAPLRVGRLATGNHAIEIVAPEGYVSKTLDIELPPDERQVFEVALDAAPVMGRFASEPPGATVTLISDGEPGILGESPAKADLDPSRSYQVIFSLDGYQVATRNVVVEPGAEVEILAVMVPEGEAAPQARKAAAEPAKQQRRARRERAERSKPAPRARKQRSRDRHRAASTAPSPPAGKGMLMLGAKPPCQIYVDGRNTGLTTPQRSIQLSPGKHKITLVNREFEITKTYAVNIQAGKTTRMIKDLSSRID